MIKQTKSKIAIDIQDLESAVILDSLLDNGGELFKTQKQRKTILIGRAAMEELKRKYSLNIEEGQDGVSVLRG